MLQTSIFLDMTCFFFWEFILKTGMLPLGLAKHSGRHIHKIYHCSPCHLCSSFPPHTPPLPHTFWRRKFPFTPCPSREGVFDPSLQAVHTCSSPLGRMETGLGTGGQVEVSASLLSTSSGHAWALSTLWDFQGGEHACTCLGGRRWGGGTDISHCMGI